MKRGWIVSESVFQHAIRMESHIEEKNKIIQDKTLILTIQQKIKFNDLFMQINAGSIFCNCEGYVVQHSALTQK